MELISREEAMEAIRAIKEVMLTNGEVINALYHVPTIESRPTGVWVGIDQYPHEGWECSNCGKIINADTQDELEEHEYCHKCGAKMSTPWADTEGENDV